MKHKFIYHTSLLLLLIIFTACGAQAAPMTEKDQAAKYGLTIQEYRENKRIALAMNMSVEDHLKSISKGKHSMKGMKGMSGMKGMKGMKGMSGMSDNQTTDDTDDTDTSQADLGLEDLPTSTNISPEKNSPEKKTFVTGRVISNKVAEIFPRRAGVVSDILVDVGDRVKRGQTLALLLPVGMTGEGAFRTIEKKELSAKADINLLNAKNIRNTNIALAKQKLVSAKNELKYIEKYSQQENMEAKLKFPQSIQRAVNSIGLGMSAVSNTLFINSAFTRNQADLGDTDSVLGALDWNLKHRVLQNYLFLLDQQKTLNSISPNTVYTEDVKYTLAQVVNLLEDTRSLLDSTVASGNYTIKSLSQLKNNIDSVNIKLKKSMDELELAIAQEKVTTSSSDTDIVKAQEKVAIAESALATTTSQEDANVAIAKKSLLAAKASYQSTEAGVLNTHIISPFSGVIAERFFNVGETVVTKKAIFRLDDVMTTLAKSTPLEIKFRIPEADFSNIKVGDTVSVYLLDHTNQKLPATVYRKSTLSDPISHTFVVQAKVDPVYDLPPNAVVKVEFKKIINKNSDE